MLRCVPPCGPGRGARDDKTTRVRYITARIHELLVTARELWRSLPDLDDESDQRALTRQTSRLIHLADILAITS